MFVLVVLLLHGHVWGSIRVHHLWVCPCFSSSVLYVWFVECSPMVWETRVQSQVELYHVALLTLSIIRYGSRVKWSNPGKGVAPFPTPRCSSYWKGSLRVTLNKGHQLYLSTIYIYIYIYLKLAECSQEGSEGSFFFFTNYYTEV